MSFQGPAEQDLKEILAVCPRDFTAEQAVQITGWPIKKVRQAIVMGLSQDRLISRDISNSYKIYENIAWRREWVTKKWAA